MGKKASLIALLTDFGLADGYVGSLKGVLLSVCPKIHIVDITHSISPGGILSAAYVLASVWDYYPVGTVFLSVVDPGVGTERGALVAVADGKQLITPDNGTVSVLVRLKGAAFSANELKQDVLASNPSTTFHGRDIFAPAAAWLARGRGKRITGPPAAPVVLKRAFSQRDADGSALGWIVHLDRFGNAVTSIRGTEVPEEKEVLVEFVARGRVVREPYRVRLPGICHTYADVPDGHPLAYVGSLGFLEIGVRNGSAAEKFKLGVGTPVKVGRQASAV